MIEGVRNTALEAGIVDRTTFDKGIQDLYRTSESDGVFCNTFLKAVAVRQWDIEMNNSKRRQDIGGAFLISLISVPIAFFAVVNLVPVWSWIESTFEIESIGHSGPATWCYLTTYIFILACATFVWLAVRHRPEL